MLWVLIDKNDNIQNQMENYSRKKQKLYEINTYLLGQGVGVVFH